jgi:hypothetical protein
MLSGMDATPRQITIVDNFDDQHEGVLILYTAPGFNRDGYTWRGRITAVAGDPLLARIKGASLSSGCTILTREPEGRYEATLTRDDHGFIAQGIGPAPLADQP